MSPRPTAALTTLAVTLLLTSCAPAEQADEASESTDQMDNVVQVVARGLTFEAPDEIPSGWTTFRFTNEAPMVHFAVVERLPEGVGIAEQQEVLAPIFQDGMDLLAAGDVDAAMEVFGGMPEWFGEIVFTGGPGLTSPGHTSQATVYLEPGTYLLECYVKTDGIFHSYNPDPDVYGMVHEFTVTSEESGNPEPTATLDVTLSSENGIQVTGVPAAGSQTVAVHFADQAVHENFAGHDLHVVRLADDTDLDEIEAWMNWTLPDGLQTPAPAEFIGGTNELPAGETGYFTVTLEPGSYAFIAEVPGSSEKGMLHTFSVGSGG